MNDDIRTMSLQAFEDLTSSRSLGQAGLHSVSERPSIKDRRRWTVSSRRGRPPVTLRRHSLMNERTRVRRSSDTSDESAQTRHSSVRKRKSDELGGIDLSEINDSDDLDISRVRSSRFASSAIPVSETIRDDDVVHTLVHSIEVNSIFSTKRKDLTTVDPKDNAGVKNVPDPVPAPIPITPLFSHYRHQSSSSSSDGESPCSVAALTRGCGACFWERSLAWSEDEDDDSDDGILQNNHPFRRKDIREHLSVPKHLGKEFIDTQAEDTSRNPVPLRRPSSSRIVTLESDSRRRLPGAKMFRQTDVDNVTEIHWEEKVLDTTALEMMAKLSL